MGRRRGGAAISAWIALDKPYGMGSTEAVTRVRRLFNAQKAGHAGTLDPLATGALPIALGEATKTVAFLMEARKVYRFAMTFGAETRTADLEGEVIRTCALRPSVEEVAAAARRFVGAIHQVPHAYSAIRVGGERAYDLARQGLAPELEPRLVQIHRIEVLGGGPETVELEVECGKGVYIRSLCVDIAAVLGAAAHVSALRRVSVGPFTAERLISLESLANLLHEGDGSRAMLPVETALDDIPALAVTPEDAFRLRQGRSIVLLPRQVEALKTRLDARTCGGPDGLRTVTATSGGAVVALCELAAGRLSPTRVFQLTET